MEKQDYNHVITVRTTEVEAFDAISHVTEWWATDFEGSSQKLNDVFTIHFGEISVTFQIIELVPGKKVVWLVTDCYLQWLNNKKEWKDTCIVWEITSVNNMTQISMTHVGLVPELECYNDCKEGWNYHVGKSLFSLLTQGLGMPDINTRVVNGSYSEME